MADDSRPPPATGYPVQPSAATTTNTAYAYPYPQSQNHHQNPYFYNNQAQPQQSYYVEHQRTTFIRRVIAVILFIFVIIVCVFFISWVVLRPTFPDFTIDSATVTGFNVSGTEISGAWDFRVNVLNPNKKVKIVLEEVESNLAYKSNSIADNNLAPFAQRKRESTNVRVAFAANGAYLRDKAAVALIADKSADGVVPFEVRIYSKVVFDAGVWRFRRHLLRVLCENVLISFDAGGRGSGNMTGGAKECRVGW